MHPPSAEARLAFAPPKLDEVLALLRRVPTNLPRDSTQASAVEQESTPAARSSRTLRRPSTRKSVAQAKADVPKGGGVWEAVDRAVRAQGVVKACLVKAVEAWLSGQDGEEVRRVWSGLRGEGARAVREAGEEVDAARAREVAEREA